jgi:hypothetical protein
MRQVAGVVAGNGAKSARPLIYPEIFTRIGPATLKRSSSHMKGIAREIAMPEPRDQNQTGWLHQIRSYPCGEAALHCMQMRYIMAFLIDYKNEKSKNNLVL